MKVEVLIILNNKKYDISIEKVINFIAEHYNYKILSGTLNVLLKSINSLRPRLIIVEKDLKNCSAFELIPKTTHKEFEYVLISDNINDSISAFKHSAFYFLYRPISEIDIQDLLVKWNNYIKRSQGRSFSLSNAPQKLLVTSNGESLIININEIIRIEAKSSYAIIHAEGGKSIISSKNIKHYEKLIKNSFFCRIHNSHIINIDHVRRILKKRDYAVEMSDGANIRVSQNKRSEFTEKINSQIIRA